jgi:peptidoglycan L-alanyl-D-glutamate endopeptidase CwlK
VSKIDELHPKVKALAEKHIAKCKEAGIDLLIYCTYRSIEEQNKLYVQGRTKPGKVVTNAKGGQSYHNFRVAYDCGPLIGGKVAWNRTDLFKKIGAIGVSLGLEWGGHFKSIVDLPHFQYTGGLALADFRAGKTLKERVG